MDSSSNGCQWIHLLMIFHDLIFNGLILIGLIFSGFTLSGFTLYDYRLRLYEVVKKGAIDCIHPYTADWLLLTQFITNLFR